MSRQKIFHIGLPKTGTSTIQYILQQDHRIHLIRNAFFNTIDWWTTEENFWSNDLVNVFSNENYISQHGVRGKFILTLSRIKQLYPDAKIILTLREQRSLLESRYKFGIFIYFSALTISFEDWLKSGEGMDFLSKSMYHTVYQVIQSFFPPEQIHFLFFEDMKQDFQLFFQELYSLLEISPPNNLEQNIVINAAPSDADLAIIRQLNYLRLIKNNRYWGRKEERLYKKIAAFFRNTNRDFPEFNWQHTPLFKKIEADFRHQNEQMVQRGIFDKEKIKKLGYLI